MFCYTKRLTLFALTRPGRGHYPMTKNSQPSNQDGRKRPRRRKPVRNKLDNRTHLTGVRLSSAEHVQLVAEAVTAGKTKAEVLRAGWLNRAAQARPLVQPMRVMNEQDRQLYREWVGVANNLNHLTRIAHLGVEVQAKIQEVLAQLEPALAAFRQQGGWGEVEQFDDDFTEFTV